MYRSIVLQQSAVAPATEPDRGQLWLPHQEEGNGHRTQGSSSGHVRGGGMQIYSTENGIVYPAKLQEPGKFRLILESGEKKLCHGSG